MQVSPSAVNVLAALALKRIAYKASNEKRAVPEFNLEGGASESFSECLSAVYPDSHRNLSVGLAFEIGLAIAAEVVSAGLDAERAERAIESVIRDTERYLIEARSAA